MLVSNVFSLYPDVEYSSHRQYLWCVNVGESEVIRDMLSNRHLVHMLCHLDTTTRPDVDVEAAMHEPIFTEFVNECLRIVEPQSK